MGALRKTATRSGFIAALIGVASIAAASSAFALTIAGTNGADTLRGTPKGDNIKARSGNDRITGLAGNDVLDGGPGKDTVDGGAGNDQLKVRDNARDTAICGAGRDTVTADLVDAVRTDCEIVLRPTPPAPPAPPPPPLGSARTSPIPLGQSADVGNGWRVTVTGVYPDATDAVLAANMFNDPPAAGNQFFMIAATATYTGTGSSKLDSGFAMRAVGASQVGYTTFNNSCGVWPDTSLQLDDPDVFTGGTVSGIAACWEIRSADADSLTMFFDPFLGDKVTWFALR